MPDRPPKLTRNKTPAIKLPQASASAKGYDVTWRAFRLQYLRKHPLCQECQKCGIVEAAREVDHIVPLSRGGAKYDEGNLQPLCKPCHSRKTRREQTE